MPERYELPKGNDTASIATNHVDGEFLDAMAIPLVRGRPFEPTDSAGAPKVAIVNQQLAARYWPGEDPIGKRFRIRDSAGALVEIVGVVPTGKYFYNSEPPTPFLYLPYAQYPDTAMTLLVQTKSAPVSVIESLREIVRSLDPNLAVVSIRTMEDYYHDNAVGNFLVIMRAIAAMGLMSVALAFVGLYGLVSYSVSQRTREVGIGMAVGATEGVILRMVLKQGLSLAAIGIVVGLILTVGADLAMRAAFPGGSGGQRGPAEYAMTTVALLAITTLASYLPARRAARMQPTAALRCD